MRLDNHLAFRTAERFLVASTLFVVASALFFVASAVVAESPADGSADAASAETTAATEQEAPTPAQAALERLKGLEGTWHGTTGRGKPATLVVRVVAGGTAVMEEYSEGKGAMGMMTLYHLDGDDLMLTHYCISNNQPRMRADLSKGDDDTLHFEFFDATNLQDPMAGHMRRATIQIVDDDSLSNAWTYRQDGEDEFTEAIEWSRAEASR